MSSSIKTSKRPTIGFRVHCTVHKGTAGTHYVIPTVYAPAGGRDLVYHGATFDSREEAESYKERADGHYANLDEVLARLGT